MISALLSSWVAITCLPEASAPLNASAMLARPDMSVGSSVRCMTISSVVLFGEGPIYAHARTNPGVIFRRCTSPGCLRHL